MEIQPERQGCMDESKSSQSAYSGDQTQTTGATSLRGATATAAAEPPAPAEPGPPSATPLTKAQTIAPPEVPRASEHSATADFLEYLNRSKWVLLGLAGAALAFMVLMTVQKGIAERVRIAREKRRETAVATVTPDTLLARCGAAAEDTTKEMYPVVMRTMIYSTPGNERIVLQFSRTAEENSDWVFLSMKNESGSKNYNTTEAKIAGLPCVDSKK